MNLCRITFSIFLVTSCGLAYTKCLPQNDETNNCRFAKGDSWCSKYGKDNLYAYSDRCLNKSNKPHKSACQPKLIPKTAVAAVHTNLFLFCKTVIYAGGGEDDMVSSGYTGGISYALDHSIMRALNLESTIGISLRCMNGKVYACYGGASGRACTTPEPVGSKDMKLAVRQFCEEYPGSDVPSSIQGYSVLSWKCNGKKPVVDKSYPIEETDKCGFYKSSWVRIRSP